MSFINDKLMRYPALHKIYEKAYFLYEEYIFLLPFQFYYFLAQLKNKHKKTVLFYPEKPLYYHVFYQICRFSGFTITNKPQKADCVIHFEDTTFRKYDSVIQELAKKYKVINYYCWDISKEHVDEIHKKVFGYSLSINPQTFKGRYVKKGNLNTLHDGVILNQPEKPQAGYVYQLLVNNKLNGEACDIRLPIFGKNIPFVFIKHRPTNIRFTDIYHRAKIIKTEEVISASEYKNILHFCREMGLDCGELDALRDKDSKRLYIVDANNTPAGPSYRLPLKEKKRALRMMSEAFRQAFL